MVVNGLLKLTIKISIEALPEKYGKGNSKTPATNEGEG